MPSKFDDELTPRSVIPLSDVEMEEIYLRAIRTRMHRYTRRERNRAYFLDALIVAVLPVIAAANLGFFGTLAERLGTSILALVIGYFLYDVRNREPKRAIGYFSWRLLKPKGAPPRFNPQDASMLAVVVEHISKLPLDVSNHLRSRIEKDRRAIAESLHELRQIEQTLRDQLKTTSDDSMRLLLNGRYSSAEAAIERLSDLDRSLAEQLREAAEAVLPIIEMKEKFEQLRRLGDSLDRIQAAHGILEHSDAKSLEYRLELQVLRSAVAEANAKLLDIQRLVEAQERAQNELASF